MAFVTTRGENGVDFIGTDGVDALFVLNESGIITVDAQGGNDNVDLTNETGVIGNAEVKLGEGNDIFTTGANDTNNNRLTDSTVNGGPGNDDITTEGTISTKLRGNEGDDDFFLTSNYTNTTINGNSGQDSFTLNTNITLSDSKILGGSGNDGQMDFSDNTILGVDSVIQGGSGLDTITIGALNASTSGFRVSGGADNDTINVANTNGGADGVAYNGANGDDSFNFAATNAADAVSKGGEGSDRFTIAGSGAIAAQGEAGNDFFTVAAGIGARNTLTGGAGSDTYTLPVGAERGQTIAVNSVSESAATLTGTAVTFDVFSPAAPVDSNVAKTNGGDIIDMRGGSGEELVGNRLNNQAAVFTAAGVAVANEVQVFAAQITNNAATTFAALKTALDTNLTASPSNLFTTAVAATRAATNTGAISLQVVKVDAGVADTPDGAIDGYYAVLNNTNTILDSGDMMFEMATVVAAGSDATAAAEIAQIEAAIEAGFDLA